MKPRFCSQESLERLRERVQYEDWLLESVYRLVEQDLFPHWPDELIFRLGQVKPEKHTFARASIDLFDWRDRFLNVGAPLIFVSAFKLLDMMFEWILAENDREVGFRFQKKVDESKQKGLCYPAFFNEKDWLVERMQAIYELAAPLRGTIIHDRAFHSDGGHLEVAPTKGEKVGEAVRLESADLRAMAQVCVSVLRYVTGEWTLTPYREKLLRWHLDQLSKLHRLGTLGQLPPKHLTARWETTGSGISKAQLSCVREEASRSWPTCDITFDLRLVRYEGGSTPRAFLIPWAALDRLHTISDLSPFAAELPPAGSM